MNKYYLYRHIRLDTNEVFYIGIGTKYLKSENSNTNLYSRAYSTNRNIFWKRIVNKTIYNVEIIFESNDYDFIKQKEIEFIKLYGRKDLNKGTLCNLTDGGEGITNYQINDKTRKIFSKAQKRRYDEKNSPLCDPEHYKRLSQIMKGNTYAKGCKRTKEGIEKLLKGRLDKISKRIIQEDLHGNFIKEWYITTDVMNHFNITRNSIWKACKKYDLGATCCGFRWRFLEK